MAVIHIPEEEAAKDLGALLEKVALGDEIVIDGKSNSVRMVSDSPPKPRSGKEILAFFAKRGGERGVIDEDFAKDVASFREAHPESLDSTKWD